jgi:glycosyltransferase involved in cell wall biosynthesis
MFVSGFSFIRNATKFDFPIVEAIRSILDICDEFVVAVGQSDDNTLAVIRGIDPQKIKIIETVWDESLKEGGEVYAIETNKALRAISAQADWAFYIQGDEVIHEQDLATIRTTMERWKADTDVDGLVFDYVHLFGSYDYVGDSPNWYQREVRVVRPNSTIYSYRDAQGFRKNDNQKLNVRLANATVYHYGWVKDPRIMQTKHLHIHQYWYGDEAEKHVKVSPDGFDYSQVDSLALFTGSHPAIMKERIARQNWQFEHDISFKKLSTKNRFKLWVKKYTGLNLGEYKNYKLIG